MFVGIFKLFRVEFNISIHDIFQRRRSQFFHINEPLQRQFWLNYRIRALRKSNFIDVIFCFNQITFVVQFLFNCFTNIKTIHARIMHSMRIQRTIIVENIYRFERMFFSKIVIVGIVCWCNFQTSSSKFHVNVFVLNYRNFAVCNWHNHLFSMQMLKPFVVWMDTNC